MVGVSIGLGNVWRFPYMMGKYGGSAFLFVYLAFTLLFAIPACMAEWALGRETRMGPLGAFSAVLGPRWGKAIGYTLIGVVIVADSYYIVVIANVVYTGFFSVVYGFGNGLFADFEAGLSDGYLQYAIAVGILLASLYVIYRGLNRGIEQLSKVFVPFFGAVIIYLVVSAFSLAGAPAHFAAFLRPNWSALEAEHVFAALGQAFFSLGLGGTFLLVYGSYLRQDENIPRAAILTGLGDAGAAILASLFIIPAILVFDLDMTAGPRLIFSTLPKLFQAMPAGRVLGSLFMLALFMVAFLSNLAALQVIVGSVNDNRTRPWPRDKIIFAVGAMEILLMLPSALNPNLIGTLDLIFGSGMQVFGSALAVMAVAWGLGKSKTVAQVFANSSASTQAIFYFWIRWVVPGALFCILILYIYSSIAE